MGTSGRSMPPALAPSPAPAHPTRRGTQRRWYPELLARADATCSCLPSKLEYEARKPEPSCAPWHKNGLQTPWLQPAACTAGSKDLFGARGDCRPARAVKLRTRDAAATQHFGRTHPRPARCLSRDAVGRPRPPVPASPTRLKGHEQREAWTAGKRCGEGKIDATLRETHVALAQPQGEVWNR